MSTYQIYYGGQAIEPADNVKQIYHGGNLIWERSSGVDMRLKDYVFTKSGILVPKSIDIQSGQENAYYSYDLELNKTALDMSNISAGSYSFLWSDYPIYLDDIETNKKYLRNVSGNKFVSSSIVTWETFDDVAAAAWSDRIMVDFYNSDESKRTAADRFAEATIAYQKQHPVRIRTNGGNDKIATTRPLYYAGASAASTNEIKYLTYIRESSNTFFNGTKETIYSILAVNGDKMVCLTTPKVDYYNLKAKIVVTDLNRKLLFEPFGDNLVAVNHMQSMETSEKLYTDFNIVGDVFLARGENAAYAAINIETGQEYHIHYQLYNVFYSGGYYYNIDSEGIFFGTSYDSLDSYLELEDGKYVPVVNSDKGGAGYVDADGYLWIIGKEKTDKKEANYKLFKIKDGVICDGSN